MRHIVNKQTRTLGLLTSGIVGSILNHTHPLSQIYEVCPEKVQPLLIKQEQFVQHWCNLAAKESGLECTCVNNNNFTVLVSGGSRHHWVSMCTVWLSHSKWLSKQSNKSASNFALSLNIPLLKLFRWFRRPQLWATGDWQLHTTMRPIVHHISSSFFAKQQITQGTQPHPLKSRFGAPWLLAFPKIKITFEREEISDHQWDSRKYDGAVDSNWENCVRYQGAYFERDRGITVLGTMYLVSSSTNASMFHSTWLDSFWTDFVFVQIKKWILFM